MRLVTYHRAGPRAGIQVGDMVVDAADAARRAGLEAPYDRWTSVRSILAADAVARQDVADAASVLARAGGTSVEPLETVTLGPPVPDPEKVVCLGLNYRAHADELDVEAPTSPTLFAKFRNALTGSGSAIRLPAVSTQVDFEGELALVIGRRTKDVGRDEALARVGGYMALNDVSARDLQMRTPQWTAGKISDTFAPCGPALVLSEEVPDPQSLQLTTRLNGDVVQSASTSQMIFGIAETISFLSSLMTLEVGDIIATGTPAGVGFAREPPLFLAPGDVVDVEIEGLGTLTNPVVAA
jgi:2-keto-4-pentenoate hydratase/2-oxohepta-3-ene-1,7-dioic acid hydratase in catechol pathway